MLRAFWIVLVFTGLIYGTLPAKIQEFIAKDKIKAENLSIYIAETKTGKVVARYLENKRRKPASVIKLATTYSALLELGENFRWPTSLFYTGSFKSGVISGDLIVKAFGDPTLSCKDVADIAKRLKKIGLKEIKGDIVIDRSFFKVGNKITSGFDKNRFSEYNAMPDAIMFDDHLCKIIVDPKKGKVYKSVPDSSYKVVNSIKLTNKACKREISWPKLAIRDIKQKTTLYLSGTVSKKCPPISIRKVLSHPYYTFFYAFVDALKRENIKFSKGLRLAKVPKKAKALMVHHSRPLIQIIAKTNKKSNNLYARHIFLLLGAKKFGPPATEPKGAKAVKKILGARGVLGSETILDNGCGLSRKSRTTVKAMYKLLQDAHKTYGEKWMNTLSIAGKDGTIRRRFKRGPAKGKAWMKTGTLKDAKNIAGYVKGKSGKLYTVVIFYNDVRRWLGVQIQNQIIEWIAKTK
jgi:D-alanyl-D-alanine carboxypeptidase/D-alanyl-D-alanine-endopeptidase (penicillin-binding protein 4)